MKDEQEATDGGVTAARKAMAYASAYTGTPSHRLTRDDYLQSAAHAEAAGDLRMTQRLLVLADDEESKQATDPA